MNIGLSFQVRDDIMNYLGVEDVRMKPVGNDTANYRPNVVGAMMNVRRVDALMDAVHLNNKFLDEADLLLQRIERPELFRQYTDFLKIRVRESASVRPMA
jgi:geranylgeranyl pyrophosphate synthase